MRFNNVCYASICDCVCWVTTSCACLWFLTSSLLVLQRNMFLSSLTALFRAWNRFSISTLCCVSVSEHIYIACIYFAAHSQVFFEDSLHCCLEDYWPLCIVFQQLLGEDSCLGWFVETVFCWQHMVCLNQLFSLSSIVLSPFMISLSVLVKAYYVLSLLLIIIY